MVESGKVRVMTATDLWDALIGHVRARDPRPRIMRNVRERNHYHSCVMCGNIWNHDPPGPKTSRADFDKMHTCDLCGSDQHCDIACQNLHEAEEFATHEYITVGGRRYYA